MQGVKGQKTGSKGKKMHPQEHDLNEPWSVGHSKLSGFVGQWIRPSQKKTKNKKQTYLTGCHEWLDHQVSPINSIPKALL